MPMNIHKFIDDFKGGTRSDLFEVYIELPKALKEAIQNENLRIAEKSTAFLALNNLLKSNYTDSEKYAYDVIKNLVKSFEEKVSVRAKSAKFPKQAVNTSDIKFKGRTFKVPTNRNEDQSISIEFYNDVDYGIYTIHAIWLEIMRTTETNVGVDFQSLLGRIKVVQTDTYGNILKAFEFINAFPTSLDEMQLNWDNENIQTFKVNYNYHYFLTNTSNEF